MQYDRERRIFVPLILERNDGGAEKSAAWSESAVISEFRSYADGSVLTDALTEARLRRNWTDLFLRVVCREPVDIVPGSPEDGYGALEGDHLEIFFGESGDDCWYRHFVVAAAGGRFSEFAELSQWEAETEILPGMWLAEIRIPLALLPRMGESVGFNIARQRSTAKQLLVWSHTGAAFHNIDRLGRMYFPPPDPATVTHGPWVGRPECSSVEISWETAGACAALVEYRRRGEPGFQTAFADPLAGTVRRDRMLHHVRLEGLLPDSEYEYRLKMLFPECGELSSERGMFSFRTNARQAKDFSLPIISDTHCRTGDLMRILRRTEVRNGDFAVLLGDIVTASPGKRIYYDGFLDVMLREWKKPFVCIPGNHEYRGAGAGAWFDLFAGSDGKGYFSFSHGGVFFIVMDLVGDYSIYRAELEQMHRTRQREWLKEVVRSEEFQQADFRVILSHVGLISPALDSSRAVFEVIDGILTAPGMVDLMIGGHEHCYCRNVPGEAKLRCTAPGLKDLPAWEVPFPVVLNDYCAHLKLSRRGATLHVKAFDATGNVVDEFPVEPVGGFRGRTTPGRRG